MTAPPQVSDEVLCDCLLAELRAGVIRDKLAALDKEAVGVALKHHLIDVRQAMELLGARDTLPWLNLARGGAA